MALDPLLVAAVAGAGVLGGLALLVRGLLGHSASTRLADTATSRTASLAIGEVRVSGVVETAGASLVSPLQSVDCVYYASTIRASDGEVEEAILDDERAVGFRVRDSSGSVRVFPRGAAWDVPPAWEDGTGAFGETPAGLRLRRGSAFGVLPTGDAALDRAAQVAALLTVRPAASEAETAGEARLGLSLGAGASSRRRRRYREARIEPGQVVTVVGRVLPFDQLDDPEGADSAGVALAASLGDPEITADLAEARAAGLLADSAAEAWGNAAIPGFGIGQPVSTPELDPEATMPALGGSAVAEQARRTFDIAPGDLVIAAGEDAPLVIALGPPGEAAARGQQRFLLGILGAGVAVASAVVLAVVVGGGLGS